VTRDATQPNLAVGVVGAGTMGRGIAQVAATGGCTVKLYDAKEGESWIEDDRLCDRWPEVGDEITICVLIFRDSDGGPNDYYMVTDQGPQRFWVSN